MLSEWLKPRALLWVRFRCNINPVREHKSRSLKTHSTMMKNVSSGPGSDYSFRKSLWSLFAFNSSWLVAEVWMKYLNTIIKQLNYKFRNGRKK